MSTERLVPGDGHNLVVLASAGRDHFPERVQVLRGRAQSDCGRLFSVPSVLRLWISVVFYNVWAVALLLGAMHQTALGQLGSGVAPAKQPRGAAVPRCRLESQEMPTNAYIVDRNRPASSCGGAP
ncbi:hypothetical protein PC115_g11271 [Phytophthora cactorum]|uniref:Uncharacterized protein n=1 Tax=Phytophthora cactorum TaxID=29920 RepID=A0A8T1C601_9STRA|nr:hypothetical protein PC115_g11271 [Phytophthora cactorum]